jgi:hypothetical protein
MLRQVIAKHDLAPEVLVLFALLAAALTAARNGH